MSRETTFEGPVRTVPGTTGKNFTPTLPPHIDGLDLDEIHADFPILEQKIHGKRLAFLDTAASAQKPRRVLDEMRRFCAEDYANIHRGVYQLSQRATAAFEDARSKIRRQLNAASDKEIIFTSGATAAVNLVAQTFGRARVSAGDEVLLTHLEHHSNIVPWQMLCEEKGAQLKVVPITDHGEIEMDAFARLLGSRTRLLAVSHQSNALGTINPVRRMVELAHEIGVPVFVDGAQAVPHQRIDVQLLGCDFYAFSGHKVYGPSGIGVLYGKQALLEEMPPWQGGGDMIRSVTFDQTVYNSLPHRFEAGTPNIAGAIGLGVALDYLNELGIDNVAAHERALLDYATEHLRALGGVRLIGEARERASVLSFVLDNIHPHDVGTILDSEGVAVRAGHHCAQPVMDRFGVPATVRASIGLYNTREDIDQLLAAIVKVKEIFG